METNAVALVRGVCDHHKVDAAELVSLFVDMLITDASELARREEGGGRGSDAEAIAVLAAITEQARGYAAGLVCGAKHTMGPLTRDMLESRAGTPKSDLAHQRYASGCRVLATSRAMAAVVANALAVGRHRGLTAAAQGEAL